MRLSEDQVREDCLRYFSESESRNPTVMPTAIQAIERFGRVDAFPLAHRLVRLAQTEETIRWIIGELQHPPAPGSSEELLYTSALSQLLCTTEIALALPHAPDILNAPAFDPKWTEVLQHRVRIASWDDKALWRELETICDEGKDKESIEDARYEEGENIVDALAEHGERNAEHLMKLLPLKLENDEHDPSVWQEPLMVRLAGKLRFEPAVPLLVAKLREVDDELVDEECTSALTRIGTDAVVQALRDGYPEGPYHFRFYTTAVVGHIHTDLATATCLELLQQADDLEFRSWWADALVRQFSAEGNEFLRKLLVTPPGEPGVERHLVAACTLMGQHFPELARWRKNVERSKRKEAEMRKLFTTLLSLPPASPSSPPPVEAPSAADSAPPPYETLHPFVKADKQVGRNDPCPCGSGKKFKKCCLTKGKQGP